MTNPSSLNLFLDFLVRFLAMKGFPSHGSMQILRMAHRKTFALQIGMTLKEI